MQLANESEPIQPAPEPIVDTALPVEEAAPSAVLIEEAAVGASAADESAQPAVPVTIPEATASPALLRAAYVLIFLLTVLVSYTLWPQAGGQGHLDLMPWYCKLFPPLAFSYAVVRASVASGEQGKAWNRKAVGWLAVALLLGCLIAGLTYYYHLQESQEQVDSDEGVITSVRVPDGRTHA